MPILAYIFLLACFGLGDCTLPPTSSNNFVAIESESPGMTAQQVERVITIPLERALAGLQGAKAIRSSSADSGSCRIEIEFEVAPSDQTLRQVEGVVRAAWSTLSISSPSPLVSIQTGRLL